MADMQDIYGMIEAIDDPSVDQAIAAAIPTADPKALGLMTDLLSRRARSPARATLIANLHRLPPDARSLVINQAPAFGDALRDAARARQTEACVNLAAVIRQSGEMSLAYLLSDMFRHASPKVREEAGLCMLELAQRAQADPRPGHTPQSPAGQVAYFQTALIESLETDSDNARRLLLAACMLSPRKMGGLMSILARSEHPLSLAAKSMLLEPDHPAVRRALLMLGQVRALAESVTQGLQWAVREGCLSQVIEQAHLLLVPEIARPLAKLDDPHQLVAPAEELEQLPAHVTRQLARWIAALPLEGYEKVEHLARLVRLPDALSRLSVLHQLMRLSPGQDASNAMEAVADFCFDAEESIARLAFRHLRAANWEPMINLLPRLINSVHEGLREEASKALAPIAFARLWHGWRRMTEEQRLAAGRALIKIDPTFHQQLTAKLDSETRGDRVRALAVIQGLNQGPFFEATLIELSQDRDEVVAASAVRALGTAESHDATVALEIALEHPDARVRANAVEALEQTKSTRHIARLTEMARSDANRPRANAIKALMELSTGEAMHHLGAMLTDTRPQQRISALWLVETLGVVDVARSVADLATADRNKDVKNRARKVFHAMVDQMRGAEAATAADRRMTG